MTMLDQNRIEEDKKIHAEILRLEAKPHLDEQEQRHLARLRHTYYYENHIVRLSER